MMKHNIKQAQSLCEDRLDAFNHKIGDEAKFFGYEDRINVKDASIHPFSSIGKIKCHFQNESFKLNCQSQGTGTIIGQRLIITSAHVISLTVQNIDREKRAFISDSIYFFPGNSSKKIKVVNYWINPKYFNSLYFDNALYDVALLELQPNNIVKSNQIMKMRFDYNFSQMKDSLINITGYAEKQMTQICSQGLPKREQFGLLYYKHTTCAGNSGGPVLMKTARNTYQMVGIHKGTRKNHNYCILLDCLKKSIQQISQIIQQHQLEELLQEIYQPSWKKKVEILQSQLVELSNSKNVGSKIFSRQDMQNLQKQLQKFKEQNSSLRRKINSLQKQIGQLEIQNAALRKKQLTDNTSNSDSYSNSPVKNYFPQQHSSEVISRPKKQKYNSQAYLKKSRQLLLKSANDKSNQRNIKQFVEQLYGIQISQYYCQISSTSDSFALKNLVYGLQTNFNCKLSKQGYILFLSNKKLSIKTLIENNLSHIQVLKLNKVLLNDKDWKLIVEESERFYNVKSLDLFNNEISKVKQEDLERFRYLKYVNLENNPLREETVAELRRYEVKNPQVTVKFKVNFGNFTKG